MQRRTTANSSRTAETEEPSPLSVRVPSDPPTPRNPVTQRLFDSDAEYQKDAKLHKTTLQGASVATTLRAAIQSLVQQPNKAGLARYIINNYLINPGYDFLHARTGPQGCRLAGIIRICYATLYVYTVGLMCVHRATVFDPYQGLLPYWMTVHDLDWYDYSVFQLAPKNSSWLLSLTFLVGWSSGLALLLGLRPRYAAGGCYFFLYNLKHHNTILWDKEFDMNRMWSFFLLFMPLDHITIYDNFGGLWKNDGLRQQYYSGMTLLVSLVPSTWRPYLPRSVTPTAASSVSTSAPLPVVVSQSWPMWPFRFWQVYTCLIYLGAGFGKYRSVVWQNGTALAWCWYDEGMGRFYPQFVIDLLYNTLGPLQVQTWISLVVELGCVVTIWPATTRKMTFVAIVFLHIGIELCLLMHIFEYLSLLGWVCFFIYPNDTLIQTKQNSTTTTGVGTRILPSETDGMENSKEFKVRNSKTSHNNMTKKSKQRIRLETLFAVFMLYNFVFNTFPLQKVAPSYPRWIRYLLWNFVYPPEIVADTLETVNAITGLQTGPYTLFAGIPPHTQSRMTAVIRYTAVDGREPRLYRPPAWSAASYWEKERDYWLDTYSYYLFEQGGEDPEIVPFYALYAVAMAEKFSTTQTNPQNPHQKRTIFRRYNRLLVDTSAETPNPIASISIHVHSRIGNDPIPETDDDDSNVGGLGWFDSLPRSWTYESECRYVLQLETLDYDDAKKSTDGTKSIVNLESLWDYPERVPIGVQNGCATMQNDDGESLHQQGWYGVPSDQVGDDMENENDEEEENLADDRDFEAEEENHGDDEDGEAGGNNDDDARNEGRNDYGRGNGDDDQTAAIGNDFDGNDYGNGGDDQEGRGGNIEADDDNVERGTRDLRGLRAGNGGRNFRTPGGYDDGRQMLDDIGTGGNPNYKLPHPQRKIVRRNGRRPVTRIQ